VTNAYREWTALKDAVRSIIGPSDFNAVGTAFARHRPRIEAAVREDPCPHCIMEHVWPCPTIRRCDEPGCDNETSCGWPTRPGGTGPNGGYRRTCGDHARGDLYRATLMDNVPTVPVAAPEGYDVKLCSRQEFHTPTPVTKYKEWLEAMNRTHRLLACPGCGLYVVWVAKARRTTDRPSPHA